MPRRLESRALAGPVGVNQAHVRDVIAAPDATAAVLLMQPRQRVAVDFNAEPGSVGQTQCSGLEGQDAGPDHVLEIWSVSRVAEGALPGSMRIEGIGEVRRRGGEMGHGDQADAEMRV